jgi:glucose/mannose-6-phosphate isomerase
MDKMIDYILKYPEMISDSINIVKKSGLPRMKFKRIVVCGMGGSAVGGDLLQDTVADRGVPMVVDVSRRYNLPKNVDKDTLVIVSTYSGETEETLSQFIEARKKGLRMVCVSSGGRLKKWCEILGIPFIQLPLGFKPRATLPYMFFTLLEYLQECAQSGLLADEQDDRKLDFSTDMKETAKVLETIREDKKKMGDLEYAATLMKDGMVRVYASEEFQAAAVRAKNQFNENGKIPASWAVFPELDHNEIVGYEDNDVNKGSYVLILRDGMERPEVAARIDATKEIIKHSVKGIVEIWSSGQSKTARTISLIFQADILSNYVATVAGKSPDKTDNIDTLKRVLKERLNMQDKLEAELV